MATIGNDYATLADMASRFKDGKLVPIAEVLSQDNAILDDILFTQANGIYNHRVNRRSSLPSGSYRKINEGVPSEKAVTTPDFEPIADLEAVSDIDAALVDEAPEPRAYRQSEDVAYVDGLRNTFATTLFYGNTVTTPEKFNGFATRISSLSSTSVDGNSNVIGASGTGSDVTSIWVVQWLPRAVYMAYPKGSSAGLSMEDRGRVDVVDGSGNSYVAYRTRFGWKAGLVVEDDRSIQRIANIETAGASNTFDDDDLLTALNRLPYSGRGAAIYCNRTIKTQMDILAKSKTNVAYTSSEVFGKPVTSFRGVPVRQCDAILDTETAIS